MIEQACPVDEDLLPIATGDTIDIRLNEHLDSCSTCRSRLDSFRSDLSELQSILKGFQSEPAPKRLSTIGKYLVVGRIDGGGQAEIFRAVHPTLDTEVAIKLGRKAVGQFSDQRLLLVTEGKLLAKLDHPNLARVFDLDFHDDRPFLAMEYIRGPNLRAFSDGTALPPRKAAGIVAEIARALSVVHKHGIVHMDIKPHNILIDERDRPRLIDFGMARLRHAWDGSGQPFGGTPAYMAPEQARGEVAAVGPASDTFAMGGVLYFLLTGQPPFPGEKASDSISKAGRCDFNRAALDARHIPKKLRAITLKAMAERPEDRYRKADEFADDLASFLDAPRRQRRWGLIAACGIAAVSFGTWAALRPTPTVIPALAPYVDPSSLEITIVRGGDKKPLAAAMPLNAETDRLQIIGKVPVGHHAVLLHVTPYAKKKVTRLEVQVSPADGYVRLIYPGGGRVVPLEATGRGSEAVILLSAEDAECLVGIEQLVENYLGDMPAMKPKDLVTLKRDESTQDSVRGSGFGSPQLEPAMQVQALLDDLRQRLIARKIATIRGVAYAR